MTYKELKILYLKKIYLEIMKRKNKNLQELESKQAIEYEKEVLEYEENIKYLDENENGRVKI